jgi:hypothetical protein
VTLLGLATLSIVLVVNIIILLWSPTIVLPETANPAYGNTLFLILPWSDPLLPFFDLTGWGFAIYHLLLVVAITASFAWMMVRSYGPIRREMSMDRPREGHSPLWVMGAIFFAVLAINYIYTILLILIDYDPITPDFQSQPLWALLHAYASASVWEELVTRVAFIGVPLLLLDVAFHKRQGLGRYILGGGFHLGGRELALIWASAGIFALGHVVNWDASKVLPTWIAGLAFGYLFLRLGLYAAIMLHFTVDYLGIPIEISGDSLLVTLAMGLLFLFWGILGCGYVAVYAKRIAVFLSGKDLGIGKTPSAPSSADFALPPPSVQSGTGGGGSATPPGMLPKPEGRTRSGGFYSCIKCGNTQARYQDGKLVCTRCGYEE